MASNLRVDTILPSSGTNVAIGTATGTVSLVGNSNLTTTGVITATSFSGSGANLTSIPAAQLTGTVADARISTLTASKLSGALPAISAASCTNIPAANITGTLPAISGANLTNLPASGKVTNFVVNGAMMVAQRGTSSTSDGIHTVDRFAKDENGTDESLTQAQVDVASGTTPYTLGFRKAFKLTNGNQTSGAGSADRATAEYKFEAQDIANCGWNYLSSSSYITFSYWVKSSVAQNFYNTFKNDDGTSQRYVTETGSLTADTWTKITKTIPGNSNLTFNNDNGEGLEVTWEIYRGTSQTGSRPLNAWATADNNTRTPDQTSTWWTTNNATFEITGVQLEVGDSASDFAHERYADTILKCYRYYYAHKGMLWGITSAGDHLDLNLTFPVPMRTTPSRTQVDTSLLFKNRLDQENSTSATTYSYSGVVSPTGDFWVARPGSGDSWGVSYTSSDTHAVYYHVHEGTTSYAWSAEL